VSGALWHNDLRASNRRPLSPPGTRTKRTLRSIAVNSFPKNGLRFPPTSPLRRRWRNPLGGARVEANSYYSHCVGNWWRPAVRRFPSVTKASSMVCSKNAITSPLWTR